MRRCVLQSCLTQWAAERDALKEKMRTRDDINTRVEWCRDLSPLMYQSRLTVALAEANGKVSEFSIKMRGQLVVIE